MIVKPVVDPAVIDAWQKICQSHKRLRRNLRVIFRMGGLGFLAMGFAAIGFDTVKESGWLMPLLGGSLVLAVSAAIWNNILVGHPRCPGCNEVATSWFESIGLTVVHPEAEQSCRSCHTWFVNPRQPFDR